jgi:hypothetical protein
VILQMSLNPTKLRVESNNNIDIHNFSIQSYLIHSYISFHLYAYLKMLLILCYSNSAIIRMFMTVSVYSCVKFLWGIKAKSGKGCRLCIR